MRVTRDDISETKVKLVIELGLEELTHAKQHELKEQAQHIKAPGFRAGKAPLTVVEKQIDEQKLQADIINHAINDFYGKALEEVKVRTLEQPTIHVTKFVPYTELEFSAEVTIMPKVKLGDYKKIKKQLPKVTVSEKEADDVLNNLLQRSAARQPVKRAAKNGDQVVIDFEGVDAKGANVPGSSGKDYPLELGSKTFIPGFEEGLVGQKAPSKKKLELTFPRDYHVKELAGTDIIFSVTVREVQEVVPPKLDNAFAKKLGPFETIAELKKDIKQQLKQQKLTEATNKLKDEIVEALVKKSTFQLPDILVSDQLALLEQDFSQNLLYRGITKAEYLKQQSFKDEAAWHEQELKPQAERRVAVGIVLAEVAEQEKLGVSQQELEQRLALHRQEYGKQADQFDKPEMKREVASRILTEKTVDRLVEYATT